MKILFLKHKSTKDYFSEFNDEINLYGQWLTKHNIPYVFDFEEWDEPLEWQGYNNNAFYALNPDYMKSLGGKAWWEPGEYHLIFYCYYPEKEKSSWIFCTMNWFECNGGVGITVPLTRELAVLSTQWGWRMLVHETLHACFPPTAPVLTQGFLYKPIRDIKKGDLVFTHTGQLKRVTEVMRRLWQGKMRQITISGDYRPIVCTREHPIWAIKRLVAPISKKKILGKGKVGIPQFYPACELERGDWVGMPFNDIVKDTTVFDFEKDPDFLWVLGLYLAEGDLDNKRKDSKGGQVRFTLNKKEIYLYDRIEKTMKKYGAETGYWEGRGVKANIMTAYINGRFWVDIFKELGGEYSYAKKLNERLMYIDPKLQYQIFEGWRDGDGHIDPKRRRTTVATVSYDLATQMRTILLRNHIFNSLTFRRGGTRNILGHNSQTRDVYFIDISPTSKNSFIKDNCLFVLIKDAKDIYNTRNGYDGGYVYNLEVEDDHSYQVNGVAVHNCYAILNLLYKKNILDIQDQLYQEYRKLHPNPTEDELTGLSEMLFNRDIKPNLNLILQDLPVKKTAGLMIQLIGLLTTLLSLLKTKLNQPTQDKRKQVVEQLASVIARQEGFYVANSRAQRNHNPGNLMYVGQSKATGKDKDGFCIFATDQDGWDALYWQLNYILEGKSKYYRPDMTIQEFVSVWASTSSYEEKINYAKAIANHFLVSVDTKLNELK